MAYKKQFTTIKESIELVIFKLKYDLYSFNKRISVKELPTHLRKGYKDEEYVQVYC